VFIVIYHASLFFLNKKSDWKIFGNQFPHNA